MLTKSGTITLALILGSLSVPAHGQDALGGGHFEAPIEMASLELRTQPSRESALVPIPTPRPEIAEASQPAPEIRRTASGIRIVGPRFFPAE